MRVELRCGKSEVHSLTDEPPTDRFRALIFSSRCLFYLKGKVRTYQMLIVNLKQLQVLEELKRGETRKIMREGRENFRIQMREDEVEEEKETKGERI